MVVEKKNTSETAARKSGGLVIYPILIGIYPLLAILAQNITQIRLDSGFRPLIVALALTLVVFLLLRVLMRNWYKAGLVSSMFLMLFFSYGHLYQLLTNFKPFGIVLSRHIYGIPLWILLAVLGVWFVSKRIHQPEKLTQPLNILSGLLVMVAIVQIGTYYFNLSSYQAPSLSNDKQTALVTATTDSPDVYYIILDGYSRHDVIQNYYGY
ncbi:MAG: hypothetical protein HGA86_02655, partial [Anaerolineaceae bacterium]|nr:hypothetical protein [Anaerolineaceae bacterium]